MTLAALLIAVVAVLLLGHLAVTVVRRRRSSGVRDERSRAGELPADTAPPVIDPSRGPLT